VFTMNPAIPLWIVAATLSAKSAAQAQPEPEPEDLKQQLTETVRDGNETALLQLIRKSAGRQELFALSDDSFAFEMRAAKTLAALMPESPADHKVIRQTELSLLRQTDDEGVVRDLLDGLLVTEVKEGTDPSLAITLADALYDDIRRDLNDGAIRQGKGVSGGKFRALVDTAALMLRAAGDPSRVAFFKQILTRAHVPSDQSAEVLAIAKDGTVSLNEAVPKTTSARHDILKRLLTWLCVLLALSLLMAIVWRINTLRNS
jgi:hypothetical protein